MVSYEHAVDVTARVHAHVDARLILRRNRMVRTNDSVPAKPGTLDVHFVHRLSVAFKRQYLPRRSRVEWVCGALAHDLCLDQGVVVWSGKKRRRLPWRHRLRRGVNNHLADDRTACEPSPDLVLAAALLAASGNVGSSTAFPFPFAHRAGGGPEAHVCEGLCRGWARSLFGEDAVLSIARVVFDARSRNP